MNDMIRALLRWLLALAVAVLGSAGLASVVQTQFNLARLTALGAEIPFATRVAASGHDVLSFGPLFAGLLALAFLIAFAVASALSRIWPRRRALLFPLAGLTAVATMLGLMDLALPVTVIAAARGWGGYSALLLCGAFGGWLFLLLRQSSRRQVLG